MISRHPPQKNGTDLVGQLQGSEEAGRLGLLKTTCHLLFVGVIQVIIFFEESLLPPHEHTHTKYNCILQAKASRLFVL